MKLRKFLGFLIPAGVAIVSLRFIEPEIRHSRYRQYSKIFLSDNSSYAGGRRRMGPTANYSPKFIKVEGEEGYNSRKSSEAWEEAVGRYNRAQNKGNTSLDLLLKNEYKDWSSWSGDTMNITRLMRICDRIWKNDDIRINLYPNTEYKEEVYEYNVGLEWCIDGTISKPRRDTTILPQAKG